MISGSASDLFLFAWGRRPLPALVVDGDPLVARRYAEFGFTP